MAAGLLSIAAVLLIFRIFRVQNPSVRVAFLGVALMRPVLVFLECGNRIDKESFFGISAGIRLPDIFRTTPYRVINHEYAGSTRDGGVVTMQQFVTGMLIVLLIVAATLITLRFLALFSFRRRIYRDAIPGGGADGKELLGIISALSQEIGLARPPEVVVVRGNWETPCAVGCFRHAIFVSAGLLYKMEPEELKAILVHELGHIKRRDNLRHCITLAFRDFQFFNPFSYVSIKRMNLEREKACDRLALMVTNVSPQQLAATLVRMSRQAFSLRMRPLPQYANMGFSVVNGSLLEKRVKYLLSMPDSHSNRGNKRKWQKTRFIALAALWLLLVIPLFYLSVGVGDYTLILR